MSAGPRIATVTLNPAIDHTVVVPSFEVGAVNRVTHSQADAGGKGVNVASFLAQAGHAVAATGLFGRANIEPFERLFAALGIADHGVSVPGSTRANIKIVDEARNCITDLNFAGLEAATSHMDAVFSAVERLASGGIEWFVLSGSLPPGIPTGIYARMITRLRTRGKRIVLDTSGAPLAKAVVAGPHVIKPNLGELEELTGRTLTRASDIVAAARTLCARGIDLVVVSMAARGAIFASADGALLAVPPEVAVRSTVGAGDAMVAGIVAGMLETLAMDDLARLATAFAVSTLGEIGAGLPPDPIMDRLRSQVGIEHL